MKKLTLGLSLILSSVALQVAALPTSSPICVTVPSYTGGLTFGLTGLYWRPSLNRLIYALTFPTLLTEDESVGTYHSVDPDYNWGFKANVGYIFPCSGNDVNLTYTHYSQDETDSIQNPAVLFAGNFEGSGFQKEFTIETPELAFSGVTFNGDISVTGTIEPGTLEGEVVDDINLVSAKSDLKNNTWDLDFGQYINLGCNAHLHLFGGLRYSKLQNAAERTIKATAESQTDALGEVRLVSPARFQPGIPIPPTPPANTGLAFVNFHVVDERTELSNVHSEFNGIGPRMGLDLHFNLGCRFGLVGSLSSSLLVGEIDSQFRDLIKENIIATVTPLEESISFPEAIGSFGAVRIAELPFGDLNNLKITDVSPASVSTEGDISDISFRYPDQTRVVPNIDAKLGLEWAYQFCNCSRSKLTIEAGYQVSHYFNALDRISLLGTLEPEANSRQTLDISFDGPYVGVQVAL